MYKIIDYKMYGKNSADFTIKSELFDELIELNVCRMGDSDFHHDDKLTINDKGFLFKKLKNYRISDEFIEFQIRNSWLKCSPLIILNNEIHYELRFKKVILDEYFKDFTLVIPIFLESLKKLEDYLINTDDDNYFIEYINTHLEKAKSKGILEA